MKGRNLSLGNRYELKWNIWHKRRLWLDKLAYTMRIQSPLDWLDESESTFKRNGGGHLFQYYYKHSVVCMLANIYPEINWNDPEIRMRIENRPILLKQKRKLELQRKFMLQLFYKLELKTLQDWVHVSRSTIIRNQGKKLIVESYANNLRLALSTIYPNFNWDEHYNLFIQHSEILQKISSRLNIKCLDDWYQISRFQLKRVGALPLLRYYNNDLQLILRTFYPHHSWSFTVNNNNNMYAKCNLQSSLHNEDHQYAVIRDKYSVNIRKSLRYRPYLQYYESNDYLRSLILHLIQYYNIERKEDWYRLPTRLNLPDIDIFQSLSQFYSDIAWCKTTFQYRSKLTSQRQLIHALKVILTHHHLIIENYHHPQMKEENQVGGSYQLDIFFPSLSLGIEYQGEHHYQETYYYTFLENLQLTDRSKLSLSSSLSLSLLTIPYWWDRSPHCLFPTLRKLTSLPLFCK